MPRPRGARASPAAAAGPSPTGSSGGGLVGAMADASECLEFMASNAAQHEAMAAAAGELPHWRRRVGDGAAGAAVPPCGLQPAPGLPHGPACAARRRLAHPPPCPLARSYTEAAAAEEHDRSALGRPVPLLLLGFGGRGGGGGGGRSLGTALVRELIRSRQELSQEFKAHFPVLGIAGEGLASRQAACAGLQSPARWPAPALQLGGAGACLTDRPPRLSAHPQTAPAASPQPTACPTSMQSLPACRMRA